MVAGRGRGAGGGAFAGVVQQHRVAGLRGDLRNAGAHDAGADDTTVVTAGNTISFGLNVPGGVGHFKVLQIIRESGGAAVAVSETDTAAELVTASSSS